MKTAPKPPAGTSREATSIWRKLHAEYDLTDEGAIQILIAGLTAYDVMRQAEVILKRDGVIATDRYGAAKANPAVDVARTARAQWLQALRMLGLNRTPESEDA